MNIVTSGILSNTSLIISCNPTSDLVIPCLYLLVNVEAYQNLRIFGNILKFSPEGYTTGFSKPVVSPLSKSEVSFSNF